MVLFLPLVHDFNFYHSSKHLCQCLLGYLLILFSDFFPLYLINSGFYIFASLMEPYIKPMVMVWTWWFALIALVISQIIHTLVPFMTIFKTDISYINFELCISPGSHGSFFDKEVTASTNLNLHNIYTCRSEFLNSYYTNCVFQRLVPLLQYACFCTPSIAQF